jgi:hypothetical protein
VLEIARLDAVVEHHRVTNTQLSQCFGGVDRVQQLAASVHCLSDPHQVLVKITRRDRIKELLLRHHQPTVLALRPQHRRTVASSIHHARILASAADATRKPSESAPPTDSGAGGPSILARA